MPRKRLIIGILILVEIFLCVGIIYVSWAGIRGLKASEVRVRLFQSDRISVEEDQEWRFDVEGPTTLVVDSGAGDVGITAGEGDEIVVSAHKTAWSSTQEKATAELAEMKISVTQKGNEVSVRYEVVSDVLVVGESKLDTVDFTIHVPVDTAVSASTAPGEVSLSGTKGGADLQARFGDISVENLEGALRAYSSSGSIRARHIRAGDDPIYLEAEFGDILLEGASADNLESHSNSGSIQVGNLAASGDVTLRSEFGQVEFTGGSADELVVVSNSGEVRLSELSLDGALIAQSEFGDISLQAVSAASYDLQSNSGEIRVEGAYGALKAHSEFGGIEITAAESADLDLKANSGSIEFHGSLGDGPHSLQAEFGNILLTLPEDTRLTVDLEVEFGRIESSFPVTFDGGPDEEHWLGVINGGGAVLSASVNSGNITLEVLSF